MINRNCFLCFLGQLQTCSAEAPSVYARVSFVLEWIDDVMNDREPPNPPKPSAPLPCLPSSSAAAGSRFQPSSSAGPIHHSAGTHGPPCWWCGGPGRQQQWSHSPVTQHSTVRPGHCWPPAPSTTAAHGEMFNTPAILIAAAILISLL